MEITIVILVSLYIPVIFIRPLKIKISLLSVVDVCIISVLYLYGVSKEALLVFSVASFILNLMCCFPQIDKQVIFEKRDIPVIIINFIILALVTVFGVGFGENYSMESVVRNMSNHNATIMFVAFFLISTIGYLIIRVFGGENND
jgi:hypothetical protein